MIIKAIKKTLQELHDLLAQLDNEDYVFAHDTLSGSSIGQHTRHIIELYQCLLSQYDAGVVNYEKRERNKSIENEIDFAQMSLSLLMNSLHRPNKPLWLIHAIGDEESILETNYQRELLYNLEHCIHHQALIKVATVSMSHLELSSDFGVAPSTLKYRAQCAQ